MPPEPLTFPKQFSGDDQHSPNTVVNDSNLVANVSVEDTGDAHMEEHLDGSGSDTFIFHPLDHLSHDSRGAEDHLSHDSRGAEDHLSHDSRGAEEFPEMNASLISLSATRSAQLLNESTEMMPFHETTDAINSSLCIKNMTACVDHNKSLPNRDQNKLTTRKEYSLMEILKMSSKHATVKP